MYGSHCLENKVPHDQKTQWPTPDGLRDIAGKTSGWGGGHFVNKLPVMASSFPWEVQGVSLWSGFPWSSPSHLLHPVLQGLQFFHHFLGQVLVHLFRQVLPNFPHFLFPELLGQREELLVVHLGEAGQV